MDAGAVTFLNGSASTMRTHALGLLGVTLRAKPSDAAVAIHPFVDFDFAVEPGDLNGCTLRRFC